MKYVLHRLTKVAALLLAVGGLSAGRAEAQYREALYEAHTRAYPEFGVRAGWGIDQEQASAGVHLRLPVGQRVRLELLPSADLFLGDGDGDWQANGDAVLRLGFVRSLYAGGGFTALRGRFNGETDTRYGYNLVVGYEAPGGDAPIRPFLEGRWSFVGGREPVRFDLGFNVPLGRNLW